MLGFKRNVLNGQTYRIAVFRVESAYQTHNILALLMDLSFNGNA